MSTAIKLTILQALSQARYERTLSAEEPPSEAEQAHMDAIQRAYNVVRLLPANTFRERKETP